MKLNRLFLLFVVSLLIGHGSLLVNTTSGGSDEYTIAVLTHLNFNNTLDSLFIHTPGSSYSYSIENIESIELSGELSVTDFEKLTSFSLKQNYPNPFNPTTKLRFDVAENSQVTMVVYNLMGQEVVRLLDNAFYEPGRYTMTWQALNKRGEQVSAGMYLVRMTTFGGFTATRKMVLLK